MPCGASQDGRVMVERSDRMWSTGEGNGKPLQYSCLENPMNSMKRQKGRTLKEYSQKTSQSNHTRTTALSNSMKLSHARGATQEGWVMVERSDRMWSTGEEDGKTIQYSCLENPMNSMKRQKGRKMKDEVPR